MKKMKIMNIVKKIVTILFLICLLFPKKVHAVTQNYAGEKLSEFAINFQKSHAKETRYSNEGFTDNSTGDRAMAYKGIKQYNEDDEYYGMDCVGWVGCAIHWCFGIGMDDTFTCFVVPEGEEGQSFSTSNGFVQVANNGDLKPGDILCFYNHVGIYAVDGNEAVIIHCDGSGSNGEGVVRSNFAEYIKNNPLQYVARISKDTAEAIDENDITTIFNGTSSMDEKDDYGLYYGTTEGKYTGSYTFGQWLFNAFVNFMDYLVGIIMYIIRAPFVGWANIIEIIINDTINSISGIKTASAEEVIEANKNQAEAETTFHEGEFASETTTENTKKEENKMYKPTAAQTNYKIDIEDIIYNRVPVLDVDFFDVDLKKFNEQALKQAQGSNYEESMEENYGIIGSAISENIRGGEIQVVSKDSAVYVLRSIMATWYTIIRRFSIIALLIILIYLGIRLAISTTGESKAKYKSMLIAWLTSFIIVFCIQYFMIFVINVNQEIVTIFEKANGETLESLESDEINNTTSLYDTIRTRAYSLKLSEGLPGTIMYFVLIYFLIRFLFVYVKRYFTVNILGLMGPVVAVKYAFDKIGGKKTSSILNWMYDFALNVLLQSVHAILYTVLMSLAFRLSLQSIAGFVLALCILNFIFKAEKIFMDIFKFNGRSSSLQDVIKNDNYFLKAYTTTKKIGYAAKTTAHFGFGALKGSAMYLGGSALAVTQIGTSTVNRTIWGARTISAKARGEKAPKYNSINVAEKMHAVLEKVKDTGADLGNRGFYKLTGENSLRMEMQRLKKFDPELYKKTKELLNKNKKLKRETWKRAISDSKRSITTMAQVLTGVPMLVMNPGTGFANLVDTIGDIREMGSTDVKYGHKSKKDIRGRRGRVVAMALTGMGYVGLNVASKSAKELSKKRKEIAKNESRINDLRNIETLQTEIDRELERINKQLEKDKEGKTDKEKEKINKKYEASIKESIDLATNSVLSTKSIKDAVSEYMFQNDITELKESDIEKVFGKLKNELNNEELGIRVVEQAKSNIKKEFKKQVDNKNDSIKKKDAVKTIQNGISQEGSVQITKEPKVPNERVREEYQTVEKKLKEIISINEKAKSNYGSSLVDMKKYKSKIRKLK